MVPRPAVPPPHPPRLALRIEGGPGIGVGHLSRGLALAQAWVDRRGTATLASAGIPPGWARWYGEEGIDVVAPGTPVPADVRLLDGYPLSENDLAGLGAGPLARIDDHGLSGGGPVDLVLDQTLGADAGHYADRARILLLGPRYVLLRRALVDAAAAEQRRRADAADRDGSRPVRLLVVRGGAPEPEVVRFFDEVVGRLDPARWRIRVLAGADDPLAAMTEADLCLSAAGATSWELSLLGVPSVLVAVADNQEPVGAGVAAAGAARYLGRFERCEPGDVADAVVALAHDPGARQALSRGGGALVDGRGAARVATRIRSLLVGVRPATEADAERIHRWNDDPMVRASSFAPEPIPWDHHVRWFAERLANPTTPVYVATDATGADLGVVRFAVHDGVAVVGVALAAERRGQGWGGAVVAAGVDRLWADSGPVPVEAQVKAANAASSRAFLDADFDPAPPEHPGTLRYARRHGPHDRP